MYHTDKLIHFTYYPIVETRFLFISHNLFDLEQIDTIPWYNKGTKHFLLNLHFRYVYSKLLVANS